MLLRLIKIKYLFRELLASAPEVLFEEERNAFLFFLRREEKKRVSIFFRRREEKKRVSFF